MLQFGMLPHLATIVLSSLSLALAAPRNGNPDSEGVTTLDGVPINQIPSSSNSAARPFNLVANDRTGWTATADSYQTGNEPQNVLDGNTNSFWHTKYNPTTDNLPHTLTIDMKTARYCNGLSYQPRQDGNQNGNIGQHKIYCSLDGNNFGDPLVIGTYRNDAQTKTSVFAASNCRYIRLTAQTEVNGKPWSSAAEINILSASGPPPSGAGVGKWGPTIDTPLVAVSLALEWTGNVLMWSSYKDDRFTGGNGGMTLTATYFPGSGTVTQRTITNTNHDMFCEGLSIDFNGRIFATGGNDNARASLYDPGSDSWSSAPDMKIGRGYQAQTTLSDGRTFVIGGSWSGGQGGKNGEIYSPASNSWSLLSGCPVAPMLTADAAGVYRADNHGWLFGWKGGSVFQAGPSKAMNWYSTGNAGGTQGAGNRAADGDSMNGNAVMYDAAAGKILTLGGAVNYNCQDSCQSTVNAHIITIGAPNSPATAQKINDMYFQRAFHNTVLLPGTLAFIVGGQVVPIPFSDDTSQLTPEIWNSNGFHFVKAAPQPIPRNYHSTAILLPDATVLSGGGGLCGDCATNHFDMQVYYPPYLFTDSGALAARPTINSISTGTVKVGGSFTVSTTGCSTWSLIRFGSTTHTVNTDQRRLPITANGNTLTLPNDPGVCLPGYWLVFCLNTGGVPSLGKTLKITP